MEELINQLVARIGIDKSQAEQVVSFLKENAHKLPEWLNANDAVKDSNEKRLTTDLWWTVKAYPVVKRIDAPGETSLY